MTPAACVLPYKVGVNGSLCNAAFPIAPHKEIRSLVGWHEVGFALPCPLR